MKKYLLFTFLVPLLFSCSKNSSPKETAQEFIKALSTSDLTTAASFTSADTKAVLDQAKKETKNTANPGEIFQFASLTEKVTEKKAEVQNEVIAIPLVKEDDGWKVALNETLLHEIQGREELLAIVKTKWESLQKEYEVRMQVVNDYLNYKKGIGTLSPKVAALNEAVNGLALPKDQTRETLLTYAEKQHQLDKVLDDALEPSHAANRDLSLNYFLQISNAGDRIKAAENTYQAVAESAHSPVYAPLPFKATQSVKVNRN
jgi:hypothetical protein